MIPYADKNSASPHCPVADCPVNTTQAGSVQSVGAVVGDGVGLSVGGVGAGVGSSVGAGVGLSVGDGVGSLVGPGVGSVGDAVGAFDGTFVDAITHGDGNPTVVQPPCVAVSQKRVLDPTFIHVSA